MKYPMKEVNSPFGGTTYREMTPEEYEEQLQWYRNDIERHENATSGAMRGYVAYLKSWFSDEPCDGWPDFESRYRMHQLPMSFNIWYF